MPGPAAAVEDHELGAVTNVRLLIHTLSLFGYPSLQLRVMRRARLRGGWHSVVLPFEVGARPSTNNVARDVRHHEGQKDLEEEEHVLEHDGNPQEDERDLVSARPAHATVQLRVQDRVLFAQPIVEV